MRRDIDLGSVSELMGKAAASVRGNRLWPLAIVLLVAIIAVPIALSKSSSTTLGSAAASTPPAPGASAVALDVQSQSGRSRLTGRGRNPFGGAPQSTTPSSGSTTASASTAASTAGGSSAGSGSSSSTGAGGSTPTGSGFVSPRSTPGSPSPINPGKPTPKPAPTGLAPNQAYQVSLAITNAGGGLDSVDSLARLSPLPSAQQPMLIEYGVLQGGAHVLFVVQPGTVVNGPGVCTPGPIDCEILSLAPGQTEGMSRQASGGLVHGPLFSVTGVTAAGYSSAEAARAARRQESAAGRSLIDSSPLTALSMFDYEPDVGAIVDLRNLAVGGS